MRYENLTISRKESRRDGETKLTKVIGAMSALITCTTDDERRMISRNIIMMI